MLSRAKIKQCSSRSIGRAPTHERAYRWTPALLLSLRNYSADHLLADVIAGVTVGWIALPLAMAFGIASGATPQAGLWATFALASNRRTSGAR